MKIIPSPTVTQLEVFDECRARMYNPRKGRLEGASGEILRVDEQYVEAIEAGAAHAFPTVNFDSVFKSDMNFLYEKKFRDERGANAFYDALILAAAGDCPYCGLDSPMTLDHCLPRAHYPHLSITPLNLVPSCAQCNEAKADAIGASINAYFDHWATTARWLTAEMRDASRPEDLTFYVDAPPSWTASRTSSVRQSFEARELPARFKDRALVRWHTYANQYRDTFDNEGAWALVDHLKGEEATFTVLRINGWESAAYRCWASEVNNIHW